MRWSIAFSTFRILPRREQNGLKATVACLLGRTACRVTFDKEYLAVFSRAAGTVSELAGKSRAESGDLRSTFWRAARQRGEPGRQEPPSPLSPWPPSGVPRDNCAEPRLPMSARRLSPRCYRAWSFVWPSNCGSITFTEITAVRPSRKSSLAISTLAFFNRFLSSAYFLSVEVRPRRKPVRCVPPSMVLILFTKGRYSR